MTSAYTRTVRRFGAVACMTSADHPSGTDRLQEVAAHYGWADDQIVVNVQGDEPEIPPAVIDQVSLNLAGQGKAGIATLCERITDSAELVDPNAVKVVFDAGGMALYFSRATIPWPRDHFRSGEQGMPAQGSWYRHIGIYAYRTAFLHEYVGWQPAPLEQLEQLETTAGTLSRYGYSRGAGPGVRAHRCGYAGRPRRHPRPLRLMHILRDEALQPFNTLALEGRAAALVSAGSDAELLDALGWARGPGASRGAAGGGEQRGHRR